MSPSSTGARLLVATALMSTALMATAALLPASAASAHVTVSPASAVPGGYAHLAFNVPAERQYVETTRVEIVFPPEYPLTSVSTKPVPGWTVTVAKVKAPSPAAGAGTSAKGDDEAGGAPVTAIIWQGGSIAYGEYQTFEISVGKLPDKPAKLVFKALQTYSDDQVVRWIDVAAHGAPEPAHPAPVLTVASSGVQAAGGGTAGLSTEDGLARLLAVVALVGALVAVIAPVAVPRLRRRRASESTEFLDEQPVPVASGAQQP